MRLNHLRILGFFALCTLAGPFAVNLAHAQATGPCATPRAAIENLLDWLQPSQYDTQKAAACLDLSLEVSPDVGPQRARQIIEVLDARGVFVKVNALPANADYKNAEGQSRYVLNLSESDIYVEKINERWLWSARTVSVIPKLYRDSYLFDTSGFVRNLPGWMRTKFIGVTVWQMLGLLGLIFVCLISRLLTRLLAAGQARQVMRGLRVEWGEDLLEKVLSPVGTMVATAVAIWLLPVLRLHVKLNQLSLVALRVVLAVSTVVALYRLVDLFTAWLEQKALQTETKLDDQLVPLANRALKVFIVAIGTVFVLQNLNYDVAGLLAGLGIGGLAFALAAKDTIANLFGSATIFASRPFQIGDSVLIGGAEGTVESVGFRSTRIRTFYNSLVSIPNSKVADSVVDNYGAREFRRLKLVIGLTYDTTPEQMQAFVEGVRAIIKANEYTRKDYYEVYFNSYGDFSLNVLVYAFFKVPGWSDELRERHNILLEIMRLAEALNVQFAFPTQTLHVDSMREPAAAGEPVTVTRDDLASRVEAFGPGGADSQAGGIGLTHGFLAD